MNAAVKWILTGLAIIVVLLTVLFVGLALFFNPNDYKGLISKKVQESTGLEVTIKDDIGWSFFPWLAISSGNIVVANPPGFSAPSLATVGSVEASVKLLPLVSGRVETGTLRLQDMEINLETDRQGRGNLDGVTGGEPGKPAVGAPEKQESSLELAIGEIELRNIRLNQFDARTGAKSSLSVEVFSLAPFEADTPIPYELIAALDDGQGGRLSAAGKLETNADFSKIGLPDMDVRFEPGDPGLPSVIRLAGNGHVSLADDTRIRFEQGKVSLDDTDLDTSADILLGARNAIRFDVRAGTLDLDKLLPAEPEKKSGGKAPPPAGDDDFAWLRDNDLSGTLKADRIVVSGIGLEAVDASLKSDRGLLTIAPVQATIFQGKLGGSIEIDARKNPVTAHLQPTLASIAVQDALKQLLDIGIVSGTGSMDLDVRVSDLDPETLLKNLTGTGKVKFADGAIEGIDIGKIVEAGLSAKSLTNLGSGLSGKTPFADLTADFAADDGLIRMPSLALISPLFDVNGTGLTNLVDGDLDFDLSLLLKGALKDQAADKFKQLESGQLPLSIKGNVADPEIALDFESLVKGQVDERLDEEKDKLEEKLRDKLKDKLKF